MTCVIALGETAGKAWRALLAVAAGVLLSGCTPSDGVRVADPCPGVQPVSLGEPENIDKSYATFEVVSGPVWLTVTAWEPGPATSTPFDAPFFVGPMSAAPDAPDAAVARLADQVVKVVEGQYTQVELEPGVHWVLTNSVVGQAEVVACGDGAIGEVVPAP